MKPAALEALHRTVYTAAEFFVQVDERLHDGNQSARAVLAHLVFWHREYARIVAAFAQQRQPELLTGKYRELNARADREFQMTPMRALVRDWKKFQRQIEQSFERVAQARVRLPFKAGSIARAPDEFCAAIDAHIRGHLVRLERAQIEQAKRKR